VGEERRTYHWGAEPQTTQRLTVAQAAEALGITEGAVRSRIKRGTLDNTKESGTVYVLLGGGTSEANQTTKTDAPTGLQSELVDELRDQVRFLREELARKDAILLRMAENIPQIESPPEPRESPESPGPTPTPTEAAGAPPGAREYAVTEQQERAEPRPADREAQEPSQEDLGGPRSGTARGSWWRRMFGG
jgi:hypothetical protein